MKVTAVDSHFTNGLVTVELPFLKWFLLHLHGHVYLYHARKQGWNGQLPFYIVYCKVHNLYYLDYPHGYNLDFTCPKCCLKYGEVLT